MEFLYTKVKQVYYFLLELFTLGRGINVTINGFRFKLPSRYYRLFTPDYEKETYAFFDKYTVPKAVVLDIGAHFGIFSIYFAKKFKATVYSFEPSPATQEVLKNVIKINGCVEAITPFAVAISEKTGKAKFFIHTEVPIAVSNSLVDYDTQNLEERKGAYEVDVISIDEFVSQKSLNIDVLKIDAEGVELSVLKGAANTFLNQRPIAMLGLHPFTYDDREKMLSDIWDILLSYRMKVLSNGMLISKQDFCEIEGRVFDVQLLPEKN